MHLATRAQAAAALAWQYVAALNGSLGTLVAAAELLETAPPELWLTPEPEPTGLDDPETAAREEEDAVEPEDAPTAEVEALELLPAEDTAPLEPGRRPLDGVAPPSAMRRVPPSSPVSTVDALQAAPTVTNNARAMVSLGRKGAPWCKDATLLIHRPRWGIMARDRSGHAPCGDWAV